MLTPEEQANLDAAAPLAIATEASSKVPAALTLAQWALESEWGAKMPPGSNNPFGIKALPGQPAVQAETTEVIGGTPEQEQQPFRQFSSLAEAFEDHAVLLSTGKPYRAAFNRYLVDGDAQTYLRVMCAYYSTSPSYYVTLTQMIANPHIVAALQAARAQPPAES